MAISFNQQSVQGESAGPSVRRQALLDEARVPAIKFSVERVVLEPKADFALAIAPTELAWFQVLEGEIAMQGEVALQAERLTDAHVVFLPPGFNGRVSSLSGAALLLARIPDAARHDPAFDPAKLGLRIVDWTREPVLLSEYDARKRIYLVTPKLFSTKAIKGEMIIYPPGTEAANHHHEGAAHFMYILDGGGTCFANEQPFPVRKGDVVYYRDGERHYLRSDEQTGMRFVEFFVPGSYKTVWAPGANVCTWTPSGKSIRGEKAAREIQAHSSAAPTADI
jgi:quercetin dioxygenase-like cupin family protein